MLYLVKAKQCNSLLHRDIDVCGTLPWAGAGWLERVSCWPAFALAVGVLYLLGLVHREFTEWVSPGFLACFDHSSCLTPLCPSGLGQVPFSTSLLLSVVLILASVEEKRKPGHFAIQVNL